MLSPSSLSLSNYGTVFPHLLLIVMISNNLNRKFSIGAHTRKLIMLLFPLCEHMPYTKMTQGD